MVTICTTSLTLSNSMFCPHSVFMCFVWISEQTAIISLYNIICLAFITKTDSVYCGVRTECLNIIPVDILFVLSRAVLWQLLPVFSQRRSRHWIYAGHRYKFHTQYCDFPQSVPFHTHLHLHAGLTRRTNQRSLGTFHKAMLFLKSRIVGQISTFIWSL